MGLSATSGAACMAALLAAAGLGGCMKSTTYGTGETPQAAILREVTGGIVGGGEKEKVVYQARAPLVLPASAAQLPAPAPAADVASAQWPDDPDQGPEALKEYGDEESLPGEAQAEFRRLRPLAAPGRAPRTQRERTANFEQEHDPLRTRQQRKEFQAALDDAEGIPEKRRYLTDPPDTIREPAASAPQQFEEIEKRKKGNFLTRLFD